MKTKQIKGAVEILLVDTTGFKKIGSPIPEDLSIAYDFRFYNGIIEFKLPPTDKMGVYTHSSRLFFNPEPGNWKFHCRLSEMTEEQAEILVHFNTFGYFDDYTFQKGFGFKRKFETATESFQSLLEANGVLKENPQGEKPFCDCNGACGEADRYDCGYDNHLWQEADANVFNPETTLVFIKQ